MQEKILLKISDFFLLAKKKALLNSYLKNL